MNEPAEANPTEQPAPILVAVDFSSDAEAALLWACGYALCIAAPVIVLHVVHDPASAPGFYRTEEQKWSEPMAAVAEHKLTEFMARMRDQHRDIKPLQSAETRLVPGLPPGRIVEMAERLGARLVVVGSTGRTGLAHVLLGSVAERVVQLARVPVVVVKAE